MRSGAVVQCESTARTDTVAAITSPLLRVALLLASVAAAPLFASCNENTGEAQAQTQSAPPPSEVTVRQLAATLIATVLIPLFYRLIAWRDPKQKPAIEAVLAFPQAEHP
jgi:hypothetical protein